MKRIGLLVISLIFAFCLSAYAEDAEKFTSGDYEYVLLDDGTAEIVRYNGEEETLDVPDLIDGYKVTSIGVGAFAYCTSLNTVTLPDSITNIGANVFFSCDSLNTITLPDSIKSIGNGVFRECYALEEIIVSVDHPTLDVIDGLLYYKPEKRLVFCPLNKTAVELPQGIQSIGGGAFFECASLNTISLPDSLTNIEAIAFSGCTSLSSITLPDSVTTIGAGAFYKCTSLSSITLPDSVTSIGEMAFSSCTSLSSITLPDSVTSIGEMAFFECPNLTITVSRYSYAAKYCEDNELNYIYTDPSSEKETETRKEADTSDTEDIDNTETDRIECDGFDTPEEAVIAFCEALKDNDFRKAVSTFAIESYCSHFSYADRICRSGIVSINETKNHIISSDNETMAALTPLLRSADVITQISRPLYSSALDYMGISEDEQITDAAKKIKEGNYFGGPDVSYSEARAITDEMQKLPDFTRVEISEPISPIALNAVLSYKYISERTLTRVLADTAFLYNADGYTELGVILEDQKFIYLVTMSVVKYGNKWYNYSMSTILMSMFGRKSLEQGIMGGPKYEIGDQVKNLLVLDSMINEPEGIDMLIPGYNEFKNSFEEKHEEFIQNLQNEAKAQGLNYDPSVPWRDQLDLIRELAARKNESYSIYGSYVSIYAMTFDEMLAFFSEEELA